ncbi:hypothetical protein BC834DRAFT_868591 [Gloeopeniophorella convolvens]|nr:hypothetical protein BC834DRAFT_868591 [Gloeopeniophorella convolvens]
MRRIASALGVRRSDKPDHQRPPDGAQADPPSKHLLPRHPSKKAPRRLFGTLSRITVSTEQPVQSLEHAHSSSASSTGSASLRTPEDDHLSNTATQAAPSSSRKAWIPWLAPKKSDLHGQPHPSPAPPWSDATSRVSSRMPPPVPLRQTPDNHPESDDDTSESESSESEAAPPPPKPVDRTLSAVDFVETLTTNNLAPAFSPPPLLHYPNSPIFPRSSNASRTLVFRDTVESTINRKRILRQIQRQPLASADRRLLATFGSRLTSAAQRRTLPEPDEGARYDLKHVQPSSLGLKRWIARPYFEERSSVWVPDDAGAVVCTAVKGSGFGVWALDVSEPLELLAGLDDIDDTLPPMEPVWEPPPTSSSTSSLVSASAPPVGKHVPYKAVSSPLRHNSGSFSESSTLSSPPTEAMTPVSTTYSIPKRGVRFAEGVDKEDQVPLSYILRHQKRREEKARFLKQEQERRRHEEERLRHEAEREQWEQEKRQWQKEKRVIEEAKKQRQYAEELAAARARRESHYALPSSQSKEADRRPREAYARPAYDSRKPSDYSPQTHPPLPRNDSSSSSLHGNLPRSESASPYASRPGSTYSMSSSEDVRARATRSSRRGSMISESSQRSVASPLYAYGWSNVPPVPPMPQVPTIPIFPSIQMMPVMPQYVMDMPLLPPAAPFMFQQYGRSRSRDSSPSRGNGQSHSAERGQRSSDRSSPRPSHHRSNSDDHGGRNSPAHSQARTDHTSASRTSRPTYISPPGKPRTSMPAPPTQKRAHPARRQTALS